MKVSVVPGAALTCWMIELWGLKPVNQLSPVVVRLPSVSQPVNPASDGLIVTGPLPFTPSHFAIALQMWFFVKQTCRWCLVFGTSPGWTRENVCGPTCDELVLLRTCR